MAMVYNVVFYPYLLIADVIFMVMVINMFKETEKNVACAIWKGSTHTHPCGHRTAKWRSQSTPSHFQEGGLEHQTDVRLVA